MLNNRSVPANILLPHLTYSDIAQAILWLKNAFGFQEHFRYGPPDGPVQGAQLFRDQAWIMLNTNSAGRSSPVQLGGHTQSLTIFVEDVESHYLRAQAAGAKIVEELHETEYGEQQYGAEDPEGHLWLFARHARDVDPPEWGARLTTKTTP